MVKIKYFFQRYWLFILLAFMATVIIGIVLIKPRLAPTEIAQPATLAYPLFPQAKILDTQISYQLALPDKSPKSPKNLPVYRVRPAEEFDYSSLVTTNLEGEPIVTSAEQAASYAKGFLKKNKRWSSELENGEYETDFLKVGGFEVFKANNFEEADIITIHFFPKIDNLLIVGPSPFSGLMEIWIGKNSQVQKVKDFLAYYDTSLPLHYPLITFDQAWQNIEEQKGTVVSLVKQEETYVPTTIGINSITINQVFLAYYQPPELPGSLQPIWVFKGTALLQDRTESEVAVYLSAIEETYFTPEP